MGRGLKILKSHLPPPVLMLRSCETPHPAASRGSYVIFTRKSVRLSSHQDDAIRNMVETWADAVPALA